MLLLYVSFAQLAAWKFVEREEFASFADASKTQFSLLLGELPEGFCCRVLHRNLRLQIFKILHTFSPSIQRNFLSAGRKARLYITNIFGKIGLKSTKSIDFEQFPTILF